MMTCRRDFITGAVFPGGVTKAIGAIGGGFRVLEAGERDDLFVLLKNELPGAVVEQQRNGKVFEKESFDYIAAAGLTYLPHDEETDRLFREWLACLKPAGVMAAHVCGYSGYYGAVMLGAVIRRLGRGKNRAGIVKIAQAVLRELPETHPAFACEILKSTGETAIKELLELSEVFDHVDKLYTVSRLLEAIPRWGGCFLRWVLPALYDPTTGGESLEPAILRRLNSLPEPRRSVAAELLTASPPDHYFLIQKM